ncbi:MAG: hypothetical protein JW918_16795 [Anaerolineae bacterium]|nr:hypothetical protein [Anaerolineae bacterium]
MLSETYDLHVYHVDEAFEGHRQRVTLAKQPILHKWADTPWSDLWMRPTDVLLQETIACYEELFDMVLEDLLSLSGRKPILVEGTSLLPYRVDEVLPRREQGIWLVPTERFQRAQHSGGGTWVEGVLRECGAPEQAFRNWMDRDVAAARWMLEQARGLGLICIEVDGRRAVAENAQIVAKHFGLVKSLTLTHYQSGERGQAFRDLSR